ncbi:MAG: biotin--[acetyl-CoA-carboxylase] ligase [Oscillatoriaceae cyanobacterium Prado104]|nr:biotin--[acetyl-CoA-carboxylase] ligase [Oscillatoriaceae cyanobacterium Prado104]
MFEQSLIPPESINRIPENIPEWLHWLDSCPSTNTWAIDRASQLDRGNAVFTRNQTGGRGQFDRTWHSPPGVFTASFILDLPHSNLLSGLSLAVGLAVIYAIEDLAPDCCGKLQLKWPNDISIDRQKLAGILCETAASNTSEKIRVVVGIGLNRCVDFAAAGLDASAIGNAVSLHSIVTKVPDELSLLDRLRHYLLQAADVLARSNKKENSGLALLLPELRRRDALLGCEVAIELASETITVIAAGIDEMGRLLVRFPNGEVRALTSGRVRWI